MKKAPGFTLVELMVTIAIAAILVTVAVPSFNTLVVSWRLSSATNELISAVHMTRSEAIRLNREISLCRSLPNQSSCGGGNAAWVAWVIKDADPDSTNVLRRGTPGDITSLRVSSSFAGDELSFGPDGLPTGTGTLTLCVTNAISDNRRVVSVGPGNRVSVDRQTGNCP